MLFQLISDTHGRFENVKWDPKADIILASGDISENIDKSIKFLLTSPVPVIYIAGNHEYYKADFLNRNAYIKEQCDKTNGHITFLDKNVAILPGVRVLGSTLWSDFNNFDSILVDAAEGLINDYFYINAGSIRSDKEWLKQINKLDALHERARRFFYLQGGIYKNLIEAQYIIRQRKLNLSQSQIECFNYKERFSPSISYLLHKQNLHWLEKTLSKPFDGETIVMTHHAPSKTALSLSGFSISPYSLDLNPYINNKLSTYKIGAYVSPMESLVSKYQIDAWVHGHLHNKMLYRMGSTVVHCNPTGTQKDNASSLGSPTYSFNTGNDFKTLSLHNHINHCLNISKGLLKWYEYAQNDFRIKDKLCETRSFVGIWEEFSAPINSLLMMPLSELPDKHNIHTANSIHSMIEKNILTCSTSVISKSIEENIQKIKIAIDYLHYWNSKIK